MMTANLKDVQVNAIDVHLGNHQLITMHHNSLSTLACVHGLFDNLAYQRY